MKRHKAAGPDEIVTKMITSLEENGVRKVTYHQWNLWHWWNTRRSLQINLYSTPQETRNSWMWTTQNHQSYEPQYQTHSEDNHGKSTYQNQTRNWNRTVWFCRRYWHRKCNMYGQNDIWKSCWKQKDIYMCFIDYTKAFDRVQHDELLKMLMNLNIYGKDICLIWSLYWDQSSCIRIENKMSEYTKFKRGVCPGCVLSPDLFNLCSEMILWETEDLKGFIIGGWNINNLGYEDDTVLIAKSRKELKDLLDKVVEESKKKDPTINFKKTECVVVS